MEGFVSEAESKSNCEADLDQGLGANIPDYYIVIQPDIHSYTDAAIKQTRDSKGEEPVEPLDHVCSCSLPSGHPARACTSSFLEDLSFRQLHPIKSDEPVDSFMSKTSCEDHSLINTDQKLDHQEGNDRAVAVVTEESVVDVKCDTSLCINSCQECTNVDCTQLAKSSVVIDQQTNDEKLLLKPSVKLCRCEQNQLERFPDKETVFSQCRSEGVPTRGSRGFGTDWQSADSKICELECNDKPNCADLTSPLERKTRELSLFCRFCGKYFNDKQMAVHLSTHTGDCRPWRRNSGDKRPFRGLVRGKGHCRKRLSVHTGRHRTCEARSCHRCGRVYSSVSYLRGHLKNNACIKHRYRCELCQKTFKFQKSLAVHKRRIHKGERAYICYRCGRAFRAGSSLRRHENMHTTDVCLYECRQCRKTFRNRRSLKDHERIHTGEKPYLCSVCGMTFRLRTRLKEHETMHTNDKRFKCHACQNAYNDRSSLRKHKRIQHASEIQTQSYGKAFGQTDGIASCTRTGCCDENSSCQCKHCGPECVDRADLRVHLMTDTDTYKCTTCLQTFLCKSLLTQHMKAHIAQKSYRCDGCKKTFVGRRKFRFHSQRCRRKNVQEFKQRGNTFVNSDRLNVQSKVCTDQEPSRQQLSSSSHTCQQCGNAFLNYSSLQTHLRSHFQKKSHRCYSFGRTFQSLQELFSHLRSHSQHSTNPIHSSSPVHTEQVIGTALDNSTPVNNVIGAHTAETEDSTVYRPIMIKPDHFT